MGEQVAAGLLKKIKQIKNIKQYGSHTVTKIFMKICDIVWEWRSKCFDTFYSGHKYFG